MNRVCRSDFTLTSPGGTPATIRHPMASFDHTESAERDGVRVARDHRPDCNRATPAAHTLP